MSVDLEWYDEYSIGIRFIDEEHKGLLSIMRALRDSVEVNDLEEAKLLTETLIDQSKKHFLHEENYLQHIGFDGLEEHKDYHKELIDQAIEVKKICEGATGDKNLEACIDSMEKYMIDDVISGDVAFKSFLEYKGYIGRDLF